MKEFMFIFKGPYYEDLNFSAEAAQQQMQKWFQWIDQLKEQGIYVEGRPLLKDGGKTVSGKDHLVTDGPFAESKELVGGYMIIKAGNIKEALAATKGFPDYEYDGSVEVREVMPIG